MTLTYLVTFMQYSHNHGLLATEQVTDRRWMAAIKGGEIIKGVFVCSSIKVFQPFNSATLRSEACSTPPQPLSPNMFL